MALAANSNADAFFTLLFFSINVLRALLDELRGADETCVSFLIVCEMQSQHPLQHAGPEQPLFKGVLTHERFQDNVDEVGIR
jgi:hypothetical protein